MRCLEKCSTEPRNDDKEQTETMQLGRKLPIPHHKLGMVNGRSAKPRSCRAWHMPHNQFVNPEQIFCVGSGLIAAWIRQEISPQIAATLGRGNPTLLEISRFSTQGLHHCQPWEQRWNDWVQSSDAIMWCNIIHAVMTIWDSAGSTRALMWTRLSHPATQQRLSRNSVPHSWCPPCLVTFHCSLDNKHCISFSYTLRD